VEVVEVVEFVDVVEVIDGVEVVDVVRVFMVVVDCEELPKKESVVVTSVELSIKTRRMRSLKVSSILCHSLVRF
jgi:hypothetical protein